MEAVLQWCKIAPDRPHRKRERERRDTRMRRRSTSRGNPPAGQVRNVVFVGSHGYENITRQGETFRTLRQHQFAEVQPRGCEEVEVRACPVAAVGLHPDAALTIERDGADVGQAGSGDVAYDLQAVPRLGRRTDAGRCTDALRKKSIGRPRGEGPIPGG